MKIRTVKDLGAAIRDRRRRLGMDQASLAEQVGVSRQWIIALEAGKPGVAMSIALRVLRALAIEIDLAPEPDSAPATPRDVPEIETVDIDAIVDAAKSI